MGNSTINGHVQQQTVSLPKGNYPQIMHFSGIFPYKSSKISISSNVWIMFSWDFPFKIIHSSHFNEIFLYKPSILDTPIISILVVPPFPVKLPEGTSPRRAPCTARSSNLHLENPLISSILTFSWGTRFWAPKTKGFQTQKNGKHTVYMNIYIYI